MHFVYIDESKHENKQYVYSALIINTECWREILEIVKGLRRKMRKVEGIYIAQELHASKFVAGKGQIASHPILKDKRAEIFIKVIKFIAWLAKNRQPDEITLINVINTSEEYAFERLVNRINKTMESFNSNAVLFFDAGQEAIFTKRIRRMNVYNPIPSDRGQWQDSGASSKNIVISRILEDPVFKDSKQSNFIQLVDFVAYALLRKEIPIPSKTALGLNNAFDLLEPICFKLANRRDRMGVVR